MWADGRVKEKGQGGAGYGEGVARGRGGHGGGWRRKVMGGEEQDTNTGPDLAPLPPQQPLGYRCTVTALW